MALVSVSSPSSQDALASVSLPHNLEAEQALLGAMLIDNRLVEDVQIKLRPEHFFEELHGRIYAAILRTVDRNLVANPVTLKPLFEKDEAMAELGGPAYLATLAANTAALFGARDFAQQIYDFAVLRELIRVGRAMVEQAIDMSRDLDPQGQIQEAEVALYKVAEQGEISGGMKEFRDATRIAVEIAEKAYKSGGHLSGITTGLTSLNEKMGGLHHSDLIILAGRPGMGKTALATNIAFAAAQRARLDVSQGIPLDKSSGAAVAFFSLEMSADQLATRILAEESGISGELLRMGKINEQQFLRLARAAQELEDLPLYIDDTPGLTIAALRTRARRMKRQKGIGLIVVDYLQLLQGSAKAGGDGNRVQELSEITRGLKTLAKELNVPVIALSQLSRQVENREDKRPQLSDLRESGSIEQDADIVLFVYRDEYYHAQKKPEEGTDKFIQWMEKGERIRGRAEVIVAKQRHGATGIVNVHFHKETTKFADLAEEDHLPEQF
ncbi:replicative DNA helicase [Pedomonas mirosovicensis]|uniref:replicative DNA helicase n=1 Tax=Pedomonas mirosovicensis TaxID=2908641 RepID=UPI002168C706|nr:replicative DNA helicase [Pedomonas mirosovicensis]MCH8685674.1 replicative DNA helicase [Pedomonas mirosovicensis]